MALIQSIPVLTALSYAGTIGFAAMIHGAIGVGFPLVATPLLTLTTDIRTAIVLLIIPNIAINIASIVNGKKWVESIERFWPLAIYGMIGSLIGTRLLVVVPADFFRPVLALMLVLYLNADRMGIRFPWIRKYPRFALAFWGLLAGILGGTVNVMLPALVIYTLERGMEKNAMIHVFNMCFLLGKLTQGAVLVHAGLVTANVLLLSIPLSILALTALFLGMRIRDRIPLQAYRLWLKRLLAIMALVLCIQFIGSIVFV